MLMLETTKLNTNDWYNANKALSGRLIFVKGSKL